MCKLIIQYAIVADSEFKQNKKELEKIIEYTSGHAKLEKAYGLFESLFRRMPQCATTTNAPDNATYSVFFISLRMIKIKFKMNNFKNSEGFFKWIDMQFTAESFAPECLPMSWRVTHAYLYGRFYIYKNEPQLARPHLKFAFQNCQPDLPKNRKKILKFLIPVEMNLYNFPSKQLLTKYQLTEYMDISEACMDGDMVKFEKSLQANMDNFVYGGVYMIVEKLRHLTLRNLVKKVALVVQKEPEFQASGNPSRVKL